MHQPPTTDDAVRALFDAYAAGFDDYDAEAICDCFIFPATIWQFGRGFVFADAEELFENIDKLLAAYEEAGVVRSDYAIVAEAAERDAASATLDWEQEDDNGEVVHAFTCHYMLVADTAGRFRIATIVNAAADS